VFSIPLKGNNDFSLAERKGPTIPEIFSEIYEDARQLSGYFKLCDHTRHRLAYMQIETFTSAILKTLGGSGPVLASSYTLFPGKLLFSWE
jgi:hypothetical protein